MKKKNVYDWLYMQFVLDYPSCHYHDDDPVNMVTKQPQGAT